MDEEHWLSCKDPKEMVEFLICREGGADERKLRLFVIACARGAAVGLWTPSCAGGSQLMLATTWFSRDTSVEYLRIISFRSLRWAESFTSAT
jgi:hypothetical protein